MKKYVLLATLCAALLTSCSADEKSVGLERQFAAGASATGPSVKSIAPSLARKGTTVDITINGTGFDANTRVQLALNGVNSPYVTTNRTTYVSSKQIVANVTVSIDATTDYYDVVALSADGKKGIGTDLLDVEDPVVTWYLYNTSDLAVQGDGAFLDFDGSSRYKPNECGVGTASFPSPGASGDVTLTTANLSRDAKCAQYPRRIRIAYNAINADGGTTNEGSVIVKSFMNVRKLQQRDANVWLTRVPIGGTETRTMAFSDENLKCGDAGIGAIIFSARLSDGSLVGGDSVVVHRTSADSWEVTTAPDAVDAVTGQIIHHDKAYCRGNGKLYHMPLHAVINVPGLP